MNSKPGNAAKLEPAVDAEQVTKGIGVPLSREQALIERIRESRKMIGRMCSERRPPKMSIPMQDSDEDKFICDTLRAVQAALALPPDVPQDWTQEYEAKLKGLAELCMQVGGSTNRDLASAYEFAVKTLREFRHRATSNKGGESSREKKYGRWATTDQRDGWYCDCSACGGGARPHFHRLEWNGCAKCGCERPELPIEQKGGEIFGTVEASTIPEPSVSRDKQEDEGRGEPCAAGGDSNPAIDDLLSRIRRVGKSVMQHDGFLVSFAGDLHHIGQRLSAIEATVAQVAEEQAMKTSCSCRETTAVQEPQVSTVPESEEPEQNVVIPGDGYRLLGPDEVIEKGDEFYSSGDWLVAYSSVGRDAGAYWHSKNADVPPYRRKLPPTVRVWEGKVEGREFSPYSKGDFVLKVACDAPDDVRPGTTVYLTTERPDSLSLDVGGGK
jgi:hypothetical protein